MVSTTIARLLHRPSLSLAMKTANLALKSHEPRP